MKAKLNWKEVGRFVAVLVQLITVITNVFKKAKVGPEIIDWLVGSGKDTFVGKLEELAAEFVKANTPEVPKPALVPEPEIDPMIRADCSVRPSYPDWVKTVMHPELENAGPAEYSAESIEQWLHDGQKDGKWTSGKNVYAHLKETGDLKNHLGLRDLEEIQKKGIAFFRKHFAEKAVFGWASVVWDRHGRLRVPYLYGSGGEVVLRWDWLDSDWDGCNPALRHASSPKV